MSSESELNAKMRLFARRRGSRAIKVLDRHSSHMCDREAANYLETGRREPPRFRPESSTIWSFPLRGEWATHKGDYPGNWSPFVPRNLILRYTKAGEIVLDQMVGSGTTLIECRLLRRHGVGVDINSEALEVAWNRLNFRGGPEAHSGTPLTSDLYMGDARNLSLIESESIDFVATHPPYGSIIKYSAATDGDLSLETHEHFFESMNRVARESFRVVRPDRHCAIMIGDTRRNGHCVPLAARTLGIFLQAGFFIRENIIKIQHNTRSERSARAGAFLKIAHEHLFVFRKPREGESADNHAPSARWSDS